MGDIKYKMVIFRYGYRNFMFGCQSDSYGEFPVTMCHAYQGMDRIYLEIKTKRYIKSTFTDSRNIESAMSNLVTEWNIMDMEDKGYELELI